MKSLFVSICGIPNVGKSALFNAILGHKISAVSSKVQTTRNLIRGIYTEEQSKTQLVFMDTPGIFRADETLEKKIVASAMRGLSYGELVCVVIDAGKGLDRTANSILHKCRQHNQTAICIVNKIDSIHQYKLIRLLDEIYDPDLMLDIFPVSAKEMLGIDGLRQYLISKAPEEHWHYDANDITDKNNLFLMAEITREKFFKKLKKELPYSLTVETESITEKEGLSQVSQIVYVSKANHKNIVIGSRGSMISAVITDAIAEMEEILQTKVKLNIFVKLKEQWKQDWQDN